MNYDDQHSLANAYDEALAYVLDIEALEALSDAATRGPWIADGWEIYTENRDWVAESCDIDNESQAIANGSFIAAARSAIPALIAEVRRLESAVRILRKNGTYALPRGEHITGNYEKADDDA